MYNENFKKTPPAFLPGTRFSSRGTTLFDGQRRPLATGNDGKTASMPMLLSSELGKLAHWLASSANFLCRRQLLTTLHRRIFATSINPEAKKVNCRMRRAASCRQQARKNR